MEERTRRRWWRGRERRRESTVVPYCFVRVKVHTLGEKAALACIEICTTHADVLIAAGDLIPVQVWISQWLRFASQGLTLWRKVKADYFWQRIPAPRGVTWSLVKTVNLTVFSVSGL